MLDKLLINLDPKLNKVRQLFASRFCKWLVEKKGVTPGRLVDIGCGDCLYVDAFRSLGFNAEGCDVVKSREDVKVLDADKEELPFSDESLDYIFCRHTIEHLSFTPDFFLKQCFKKLKFGGKMIIITPSWRHSVKEFYDAYTHRRPYTIGSLKHGLMLNGFYVDEVRYFRNMPLLWKYTLKAFDMYFPFVGVQLFAIASKLKEVPKQSEYRSYPFKLSLGELFRRNAIE
jgi:SAM-dependent methyltransferase